MSKVSIDQINQTLDRAQRLDKITEAQQRDKEAQQRDREAQKDNEAQKMRQRKLDKSLPDFSVFV